MDLLVLTAATLGAIAVFTLTIDFINQANLNSYSEAVELEANGGTYSIRLEIGYFIQVLTNVWIIFYSTVPISSVNKLRSTVMSLRWLRYFSKPKDREQKEAKESEGSGDNSTHKIPTLNMTIPTLNMTIPTLNMKLSMDQSATGFASTTFQTLSRKGTEIPHLK